MAATTYASRSLAMILLSLGLAGTACTGTQNGEGGDLRALPDLRRSAGNPIVGQICDDSNLCPTGTRCSVVVKFDQEGVCAVPCTTDAECDTVARGQSFCTDMPQGGPGVPASECVLFCGPKKECPTGWTCESVQTFLICRPPQVPVTHDGGVSVDMSVADAH